MRFLATVVSLVLIADVARAAEYPPNQLPMYGAADKSSAMVDADRQFLRAASEQGLSPAQASKKSVELGWTYLQRRDLATAIKRFNQGWLADPENGDVYHGFAVVVLERDNDAAGADKFFQQALGKARHSDGLYVDYGRFLAMQGRYADAVPVLRKAVSIDGITPDAGALLTMSLAGSGDMKSACDEAPNVKSNIQPSYRDAIRLIQSRCSK
jgi:Flp pilus assembly protein TadD